VAAGKPILAEIVQVPAAAAGSGLPRAQGNDPAQVVPAAASGPEAVKSRARGPPVAEVAVMLLGICRRAELLTRNLRAAKPVWAVAAAAVVGREQEAVAARVRAVVVVVVAAAAAAAAVDGAQILRSSMMSFCSGISPTESASIASVITAASGPMSV
jgi:hypothetical protein